MLEPQYRHGAGESCQKRLPSTNGNSTQRVITEREKWPWPTNTTSRDAMFSNASETARSALIGRSLTSATVSPPGTPSFQISQSGSVFVDLRGRQRPRIVAVIPFGEQGESSSTVSPANLAVSRHDRRGLLTTSGSVELQFSERRDKLGGLHPAVIGQFEIGAPGVLAGLATTGFPRGATTPIDGSRRPC